MTKNILRFLERYNLKLLIEYDSDLDGFRFRFVNHKNRGYSRFITNECFIVMSIASIENILIEEACRKFSLLEREADYHERSDC